ncbi:MAG: hypothetical protein M3441_09220 [Chloroflexota bacterium]|nr:hypothetical protein [Chloroflexota bacterium]
MLTASPNTGTSNTRVNPERYASMAEALLKVLPSEGAGLTWPEIVEAVAPQVPQQLFPEVKTVRWYSICVRLDLEAKGLVERLTEKKRLRFRRTSVGPS